MKARIVAVTVVSVAVLAGAAAWWLRAEKAPAPGSRGSRGGGPVAVTVAAVEQRDVPIRLRANGTVVPLQSVELRAQITSTVRAIHIQEGQAVVPGQKLISLDSRAEEVALRRASAQVDKDRAELANAERTLARQRELMARGFVSASARDAAQNQVESAAGQLEVNLSALEAARVALSNAVIVAPFGGRTGMIGARAGTLVQPNGAVLITVAQITPIQVAFGLPAAELASLQQALAAGPLDVEVATGVPGRRLKGKVNFVDNAVDAVSGTIRVKAQFDNPQGELWPGMPVSVTLSPRVMKAVAVVPAQAVQTGPEGRFVFVVDAEMVAQARPVDLIHVDDGVASLRGIEPVTRVVVEGAQNLRPGAKVSIGGNEEGENGARGPRRKREGASAGAPPDGGAGEVGPRREGRKKDKGQKDKGAGS